MAISLGSLSENRSIEERTWRFEIFTERGEDPMLRIHREEIELRDDGSVAVRRRDIAPVERRLSLVAAQDFGGVTGAAFATMIAGVADVLRLEDIAAQEN